MRSKFAIDHERTYDFHDPIDPSESQYDGLFRELVATAAFQRLKDIRFLGGIDYLLVRVPNGAMIRYTRFQHSLGVARLALHYCSAVDLPLEDQRIVFSAALLHDIGHAPLSHSLEPIFKEFFGIDHHLATEAIVTGKALLGRQVKEILCRYGVNIERLLAIMAGQEEDYDNFFAGPINFDTIEGILRSKTYTLIRPNTPNPEAVVDAALCRGGEGARQLVDNFWLHKDQIYRYVINSRHGVLADFACQLFMRRHVEGITADDYFTSEREMFRKLIGLRELLTSQGFEVTVMRQVDRPIAYTTRHFHVDPSGDFFLREDKLRYKQEKHDCTILTNSHDFSLPTATLTQNLFS